MPGFKVAIDGPAGSGKSTISKKIAEKLNLTHIDTGAMYRAITYLALEKGINLDDESEYEFVSKVKIEYKNEKIYANGIDVTTKIRDDKVTKNVSKVSSFPYVRRTLVSIQQEAAKNIDVIMDGRDIGTVVLPNADLKIFLTAHVKERAKRRLKDKEVNNVTQDIEQLAKELQERDLKDSTRKESPLVVATDAIVIDTTNFTIEDTIERITNEILKKENYHGRTTNEGR
ncbi:MAG: (d)CMP kinase [Paracholeplasma sp.]|jgi:cytidylate kinase|nr:(d)CMP kinase [Paracholeplasma sp.]MDY3195908.1 (d)CMP kinase [Paracholeplasma sp.]